MAKKANSLLGSLTKPTNKEKSNNLKEVLDSQEKPIEKKSEAPILSAKKTKRVSKSYFLTDQNTIDLDRYCSIQHLKTGEKINSSAIVDQLISNFLKDKKLEI